MHGEAGDAVARIAVTLDVSERRRYERDLEAARDYLGHVTSSMADGLLVFAADGRCAFANEAAGTLLGRDAAALGGAPVRELLYGGAPGPLDRAGGDEPVRDTDDEFLRADGSRLPVTWTVSPLTD